MFFSRRPCSSGNGDARPAAEHGALLIGRLSRPLEKGL
jgi:hypothetical protein